MTDNAELNNAIANCMWQLKMGDIPICRGYQLPCRRVIEKGNCEIVADYFANERKKNEKKTESTD